MIIRDKGWGYEGCRRGAEIMISKAVVTNQIKIMRTIGFSGIVDFLIIEPLEST